MASSRRSFTRAALASAIGATGIVALPRVALAASNSAYLMTYFTETPSFTGADYGLHLAVSRDGLNWTPLNQNDPVVTPTSGDQGLRDPIVYRKRDGAFVVLATDLKGTNSRATANTCTSGLRRPQSAAPKACAQQCACTSLAWGCEGSCCA